MNQNPVTITFTIDRETYNTYKSIVARGGGNEEKSVSA